MNEAPALITKKKLPGDKVAVVVNDEVLRIFSHRDLAAAYMYDSAIQDAHEHGYEEVRILRLAHSRRKRGTPVQVVETGEIFQSQAICAEKIGISVTSVWRSITTGCSVRGWTIRKVD